MNKRKYRPFGKVFKEILFSDSLTWRAKYIYAGLTMYVKYKKPLDEYWPSQETLAKKLNKSIATVRRGIKELIEAEIIIRGKSKGRCNSYRMNGRKYEPYGKISEEILYGRVFQDVFFSDSLTWRAKYIYAGLTMYANKEGICKPSQGIYEPSHNTLAKDLRVSRGTVMRGIRELIEVEIISREKRKGSSNFYQLNNNLLAVPQRLP